MLREGIDYQVVIADNSLYKYGIRERNTKKSQRDSLLLNCMADNRRQASK